MTRADPDTKAATIEMLRTRSVTAVADDTGYSTATLHNWAKAAGIKPPDGRARWVTDRVEKPRGWGTDREPRAAAAPPHQDEAPRMAKKKAKKKRRRKAAPTPKAAAVPSLDAALADIERAGKTIRAVQEAYRKVFGG